MRNLFHRPNTMSMRAGVVAGALLAIVGVTMTSCAFFMDTDELKEGSGASGASGSAGADGGAGTSGSGGAAGIGGSSGTGGTGGSGPGGTGGSAGTGAGGSSGTGGTGGTGAAGAAGAAGNAGAGGVVEIPIEDAPAAMAQAACGALARCATESGIELVYGDEDCVTLTTQTNYDAIYGTLAESMANDRVEYHADLMPACVEAYENLVCEEADHFPMACEDALEGLVDVGGSCWNSTECVSDAFCDIKLGCPGVCTNKLPANVACNDGDFCAPGLTCFQGKCAPLAGESAACGGNVAPECQPNMLCVGGNVFTSTPGKCLPFDGLFDWPQGAACSVWDFELCAYPLHCAINTNVLTLKGTCEPGVAAGAACRFSVPDQCPAGQYCALNVGVNGTCTDLPGASEPCASGLILKNPCQAYHRCVETTPGTKTCYAMANLGEPCEGDEMCYSGSCSGDATPVCVPPNSCPF